MGRLEISVSSEVFDVPTTQKESATSIAKSFNQQAMKKESSIDPCIDAGDSDSRRPASELPEAVTSTTIYDGDAAVEREEWSPIRDPVPAPVMPQVLSYNRFVPEEDDGASSDMDTDDDGAPSPVVSAETKPVATSVEGLESGAVLDCSGIRLGTIAEEPTLKRRRLPELGRNPVVQVTYDGLTRESKSVLQHALQNWSYWHSRSYPSSVEPTKVGLEGGTVVYSPALALEPTSNFTTISVWMDKPSKLQEVKIQDTQDGCTTEIQDKEKEVPLYDRVCISALSQDLAYRCDGHVPIEPEEALRCFNCGSYTHSLRNCSRPHSVAAIRNARNTLLNKRGNRPRSRTPSRYYQGPQGGKVDESKPGILGYEIRKGLGIGKWDPPPSLNQMRELGYPQGYLDDTENTEDDWSGIEIIVEDTEAVTGKDIIKDNNFVERITPTVDDGLTERKNFDYEGINAPLLENADQPLSETQYEQSSRGTKRVFHEISQAFNGVDSLLGPGVFSPSSSTALMVGTGDVYLRDGSSSRSISGGHLGHHSRNGTDGIDSNADGSNSGPPGSASPMLNNSVNLSSDPANYSFRRQVHGAGSLAAVCTNARSGVPGVQHYPPSPLGLASPLRGMLHTPGWVGPLSSFPHIYSPHIYSPHNYYHSGPQRSPSFTPHIANKAWLNAQAALEALQPAQSSKGLLASPLQSAVGALQHSGGLFASPLQSAVGALQYSGGLGLPHRLGRR